MIHPSDAKRLDSLATAGPYARVMIEDQVDSTNSVLMRDAPRMDHLTVLFADFQTAGRGRTQAGPVRFWDAPRGSSVLMSVLVRPPADAAPLTLLPLVAGLAVVQALDGVSPGLGSLKWPNDIVTVDGLKMGGVLVERSPDGAVVIGIGLNVGQGPGELATSEATSLAALGMERGRAALAVAIAGAFVGLYTEWAADTELLGARISSRMRTLGSRVAVSLPGGETVKAKAVGLAPDGALVVENEAHERSAVRSGEVRHLRPTCISDPDHLE